MFSEGAGASSGVATCSWTTPGFRKGGMAEAGFGTKPGFIKVEKLPYGSLWTGKFPTFGKKELEGTGFWSVVVLGATKILGNETGITGAAYPQIGKRG